MAVRYKKLFLTVFLSACVSVSSHAQDTGKIELNAQGIVAKVDKILEYPGGQMRGRLKHIRPDGRSYSLSLTAYVAKDNYLFNFNSRERGEQLKVLYNLGGEDIWVYNVHSLKLYHKMSIDKYDSLLATNFFYIDLSNADLQSNYTATIEGEAYVKGQDAYRLKLVPIFKGGEYGLLTIYVTKKDYLPIRIDYHDRDRAIFKFMTIVKTIKRKNRIIPVRYDMMDIRKGTVTILSLFSFDEDISFDKEIFRSEKLGE